MTNASGSPVRYHPGVEQIPEGERGAIDEIGGIVTNVAERVEGKHGWAMRATHAKATGLL